MSTLTQRVAILEVVPEHLHPFVATQQPELYTAIDHAGWRFILKLSQAFFTEHAHAKYLDGLKETGISTERIPLISEMDEKLSRFGWRAVPVIGFIPPAVFMEFLSLGILPIACEMRTFEHLAYTPAPDIVHEAAGHAPIIADPEYAAYLHRYGELARKVIFSSGDLSVYQAIYELSEIKENPSATEAQIAAAQSKLERATAQNEYVSEATYLGRMGWWTIEYGLVGDPADPKIFGAGLLSSVSESFHCVDKNVRKIPFTLDSINMSYDITRPQPQLFLTPDFKHLARVLDEFAETLAYKKGGIEGLAKAQMSGTVTTAVLESGKQISGVLEEFRVDSNGAPCFLKYSGPVQLSGKNDLLNGYSVSITERVVSVYGGAADRAAYLRATGGFGQKVRPQKSNRTPETEELIELYAQVRTLRERGASAFRENASALKRIVEALRTRFKSDWLLRFELLELDQAWALGAPWAAELRQDLSNIQAQSPSHQRELIERGLKVVLA